MQIIKLHSPADTYVGDLQAVEALIWQQINGEHTCRVTVMSSDPLAGDIVRGCIVLVPDADGTDQRFRISQPVESLDWITLEGAHISQDLAQDMIINRGWEDRTGAYVWPELVQSGISDMRFTGMSDITTVNTVRIVRQSVMAGMIGTADNTFINRWGGELQRDNYTLNMLARLGSDTPHQIAYQHNLLGIEVSEDESAIINRIVPTCVSASGGVLMLPEQWVDSPRISWTQVPHVRHMHFGDIRVGWSEDDETPAEYPTEADALAEMRSRIADMWIKGVDMPKVSARLNVLDLSKTEEYKDYEPALEMRLGDSCRAVYANRVIVQRLVAYRWDALGGEYQEITLGTVEPSLDSELAKWQTIIEERATDRAVERAYAPAVRYTRELNDAMASAMGFYWTQMTDETGRTKVYYHDEPELAQSMIIETQIGPGQRAWTDTGWNNGSPDWKYGNTDRGLLVMDIVRARGVSAEWITVSGGTTLSDKLTETDALQAELTQAVQGGGRNLALGSDEVLDFAGIAKWSDLEGLKWSEV